MKAKAMLRGFWAAVGILFLILDNRTAMSGARDALRLCLHTVIPGLLPFFFLTGILSTSLIGENIPVLRPLGRLCGIPKGGESLLIPAFLGGYPMGAKSVAAGFQAGQIDRETAEKLLFFCSNAGPSFFFGILPAAFEESWMLWALYAIHIGTAVLMASFRSCRMCPIHIEKSKSVSISMAMEGAVRSMASVCGWIMIFRVITAFLQKWFLWRFPDYGQVLAMGLLELTNGCSMLHQVQSSELRFILAAGLLGFGGACVSMQTASVLGDLSIYPYLQGKLTQCVLGMLFAACIIGGFFPIVIAGSGIAVCFYIQKRSGNSRYAVV